MSFNFNFSSNIQALFLLFLGISANFLGNTLNCSIQKILTDNSIIRHLFILMIVYFTTNFTSKTVMTPLEILKNSLIIYILYIFLTKQTYEMFLLNILLIFVIYVLFIQIEYEKSKNNENNVNKINNIINNFEYILIVTLIIGFVFYFKKQYNDHKKNFDVLTFLLGSKSCSSIK